MILYLITGFLGAGKTTFLKNFVRLFSGKRLRLIINEFGREGVDGVLLREIDAALTEINNGSIFCPCRLDQFEAAMRLAIADLPDVILVEASGLADPTGVRQILEYFPQVDYQGSICLVDAGRFPKVISTAQSCARQIAVSSLVLLNKIDLVAQAQCEEAEKLIYQINPSASVRRTTYGSVEKQWLDCLRPDLSLNNVITKPDITLQKATLTISEDMHLDELKSCLMLLTKEAWRVKGFVRLRSGSYHIDGTGPIVNICPWEGKTENRLVLLAGKGMALRKTLKIAAQKYGDHILELAF